MLIQISNSWVSSYINHSTNLSSQLSNTYDLQQLFLYFFYTIFL